MAIQALRSEASSLSSTANVLKVHNNEDRQPSKKGSNSEDGSNQTKHQAQPPVRSTIEAIARLERILRTDTIIHNTECNGQQRDVAGWGVMTAPTQRQRTKALIPEQSKVTWPSPRAPPLQPLEPSSQPQSHKQTKSNLDLSMVASLEEGWKHLKRFKQLSVAASSGWQPGKLAIAHQATKSSQKPETLLPSVSCCSPKVDLGSLGLECWSAS